MSALTWVLNADVLIYHLYCSKVNITRTIGCARLYRYLIVELAYADETKPTRSLEEDLRLSHVYAQKGLWPSSRGKSKRR